MNKIPVYRTSSGIKFAVTKSKIYFFNKSLDLDSDLAAIRLTLKDVKQILEVIEEVQSK